MKIFILVCCLALVATQISAAPAEENPPTVTSSDATNTDAAKQLTTSTEPKANDVAALAPAPTPEPTPASTPIPTPSLTLEPPPAPASTPEEKKEDKKESETTAEKKGEEKSGEKPAEKTVDESKTESGKAEKSSTSIDSKKSLLQTLYDLFSGGPSSETVLSIEVSMDSDDSDDEVIEVIFPMESTPAEPAPTRFSGFSRMLSSIPSWFGYHTIA